VGHNGVRPSLQAMVVRSLVRPRHVEAELIVLPRLVVLETFVVCVRRLQVRGFLGTRAWFKRC